MGNNNIEASVDLTSIIMLKLPKMLFTTYLVQNKGRGTTSRPVTPHNALILGGLHRQYISLK